MKEGKTIKKEVEDKEEISSLKVILKGAGIIFAGMVLGKILGYFYTIIVARLGTEPYGMLHLGYSLVSFLTIFSLLGFQNGILRFVPYYLAKNDKARVKGVIFSALKVCIPISLILAVLMFFFSDKIAIIFFHNQNLVPFFQIFSIMLPFATLGTIFLAIFTAFQKVKYEVLNREIIERTTRLAFTLVFLALGLGIIGASISYVISAFVVFIVSFIILEKKVFPILKTKIKAEYYTKEIFKFSLPLVFSAFLLFIVGWTDTLMLGFFKTVSDVGIYNAAHPTANLMFVLPAALTTLFLPIITQFFSKNKLGEVKKIYNVVSRWVFYVNLPILLVMMFFSPQIIGIIFGNEYLLGAQALSILAFGYMFFSFSYTTTGVLSMAKKSNLIFITTLILAICNVILNYLLIPLYGINGAAIATSISVIIGSIFYFIFSYKIIKSFPFNKSYWKPILASLISISLIYIITKLFITTWSIYTFSLMFFLFLATYCLLLFLFRSFELEDREMIKIIFRRFNHKN